MASRWDGILKKSIESSDLTGVRSTILRQINSDREEKEITLMGAAEYAENMLSKKDIALFDKDDGERDLSISKEFWDKDLWQDLRVDFEYNFSREKLGFIVSIMKHLRKTGDVYFQAASAPMSDTGGSQVPEPKKLSTENEQKLQKRISEEFSMTSQIPRQEDQRSHKKIQINQEINKYWFVVGLGAVLGAGVGGLVKMSIPGAIVGAAIGAGIGAGITFMKKNS